MTALAMYAAATFSVISRSGDGRSRDRRTPNDVRDTRCIPSAPFSAVIDAATAVAALTTEARGDLVLRWRCQLPEEAFTRLGRY